MASRKAKPRRKLPIQRRPASIERRYARDLLALVKRLRPAVVKALAKLEAIDERNRARQDTARADAGEGRNAEDVTTVMRGVRIAFDSIVKKARPGLLAQGVDKRTTAFALAAVDDVVRGVVTVPATSVVKGVDHKGFIRENTALIKSIPAQILEQVGERIEADWMAGRTIDSMTDHVAERFGVAESRARLIARDQVGKLNAKVTEARHKQIGVVSYRWRNSRDSRVRGNPAGLYPDAEFSHWDREGVEFRYDDPPEDGHAGFAIQCRCFQEPIIPDLEDEE